MQFLILFSPITCSRVVGALFNVAVHLELAVLQLILLLDHLGVHVLVVVGGWILVCLRRARFCTRFSAWRQITLYIILNLLEFEDPRAVWTLEHNYEVHFAEAYGVAEGAIVEVIRHLIVQFLCILNICVGHFIHGGEICVLRSLHLLMHLATAIIIIFHFAAHFASGPAVKKLICLVRRNGNHIANELDEVLVIFEYSLLWTIRFN